MPKKKDATAKVNAHRNRRHAQDEHEKEMLKQLRPDPEHQMRDAEEARRSGHMTQAEFMEQVHSGYLQMLRHAEV